MSAHVDKLAWAVSLLEGARRLDDANRIPLFLLLGFAAENALKAHLEKKGEPRGRWERSHDLADLFDRASASGLAPIDGVEQFVRALAPYHKDFVFRYPEKAGFADLFKPESSIHATDELCVAVFRSFDASEIQAIAAFGCKP
ncbi:hypothetical protein FJN17_29930 [Bradyrhizobium symbiodeficiens]|uniref:HEPN domain-containing protein n=1 Tax=Bradyrhizobium symbiodeficiens TaxID=1404367 RepID=A0ABX5WDX3_9BRAD|nr:hypothetical protein [Bradyrhizobium symbiodeficiens]QDF41463.1 hypothetical protein FJN17_29930 [Bradyrhizobium symbiodeficiens]